MHIITLGNCKIKVPGNWNELTGDQLLSLSALVKTNMSLDEIKLKLLLAFTGIVVQRKQEVIRSNVAHFWIRFGKKKFLVSASDLALISTPFISFFREEKENEYGVYPTLTRQLLPSVMVDKKLLWGPADGLSNITLREFIFTETFLNAGDTDKFIAVLYRPAGKIKPNSLEYKGDVREPFNDNIIDHRAKTITTLPDDYKKAILWYYHGCKQHIAALYPLVFKESEGKTSTKSIFESFMVIVDELANNQPAEHERLLDVLLYSAMHSLNQRISKIPKDVKV